MEPWDSTFTMEFFRLFLAHYISLRISQEIKVVALFLYNIGLIKEGLYVHIWKINMFILHTEEKLSQKRNMFQPIKRLSSYPPTHTYCCYFFLSLNCQISWTVIALLLPNNRHFSFFCFSSQLFLISVKMKYYILLLLVEFRP